MHGVRPLGATLRPRAPLLHPDYLAKAACPAWPLVPPHSRGCLGGRPAPPHSRSESGARASPPLGSPSAACSCHGNAAASRKAEASTYSVSTRALPGGGWLPQQPGCPPTHLRVTNPCGEGRRSYRFKDRHRTTDKIIISSVIIPERKTAQGVGRDSAADSLASGERLSSALRGR